MSNKAPTPPCPHLWWQQGDKCYQTCSNNSQGRNEDGTCLCNNGGNNQSCHPAFKCVGNSCVPTLDAFSCTKCQDGMFACKNLPKSNPLKGGAIISPNTPSLISDYRNNNYDLENPAYIIDGKNYWWRQGGGCLPAPAPAPVAPTVAPERGIGTNLQPCIHSGVNVPGWSALPNDLGTCIAPSGQKCCNPSTYNGQPVCRVDFARSKYDETAMKGWVGGCITPSKKETWDIFWNGGVGSINFNVGNKIALHFNIRENIGIMNSYDGKWGNEISFRASGEMMYSIKFKISFDSNTGFNIISPNGVVFTIFPNRLNISDPDTFEIITSSSEIEVISETQSKKKKFEFTKLDNTNCVYARLYNGYRKNGSKNDYKYLGDFNSYEECSKSPNIPANSKAITYHNDKIGGWARQCFSINDTNTQVPNLDYATCGIKTDLSFLKNEILNANTIINETSTLINKKEEALEEKQKQVYGQTKEIEDKITLLETRKKMLELSINRNLYKNKVIYSLFSIVLVFVIIMIGLYAFFNKKLNLGE